MQQSRTVNVRFLFGFAVCVLVTGVVVHLAHAAQVKRIPVALMKQAENAREQNKPERALDFLSRYLAFEPSDVEARTTLATLLDETARTSRSKARALLAFERILREDPSQDWIRRRIVNLAIECGRTSDALAHIGELQKQSPDDWELRLLEGKCYESSGKYTAAVGPYERSIQNAPDQIESYERLAWILNRRMDRPSDADKTINELVQANPDSSRAYLARWRYHKAFPRHTDIDEIGKDVLRAMELAPDDVEVLLEAAELAATKGDLGGAHDLLQRGIQLKLKDARLYIGLSKIELIQGDKEAALRSLERGLAETGDKDDLLWLQANLLIDLDKVEDARNLIDRLRKAAADDSVLTFLESRLLMKGEQWLDAVRRLERIRPLLAHQPDLVRQADLLIGQCYEEIGDFDRQLTTYRRSITSAPNWPPARVAAGLALANLGRLDEAIGEFRNGMTLPNGPAHCLLPLARILVLRNLRMAEADRDWDEVKRLLDLASSLKPVPFAITLLKAELLTAQGQIDEAKAHLESAKEENVERVELWTTLFRIAELQNDTTGKMAILNEAQQNLGDRVEFRLAIASSLLAQEAETAAAGLTRLAEGRDRFSNAERAILVRGLASAYLRLENIAAARKLLEELVLLRPLDLRIRLVLFDLAIGSADETEIHHVTNEIKRLEGEDGTLSKYTEAVRLISVARRTKDRSLVSRAQSLLTEVSARRPSWSVVPRFQGELYELQGSPDRAVQEYSRALSLGDRDVQVVRRAVQLLYAQRRFNEADQVLRRVQNRMPITGELQRWAGAVSLQMQDHVRAVALARQAVQAEPDKYENHLWLGQVLWATENRTEAEGSLRRAVELGSEVPGTWVVLVRFLVSTGSPEKAETATQEIQRRLPLEKSQPILAACYEAMGSAELAESQHQAMVSAKPRDPFVLRTAAEFYLRRGNREKAEEYLRLLLDESEKATPQDKVAARRMLALVLAAGADYQQFNEAMALLDQNQDSGGQSVDDRRIRASLMATRLSQRSNAISILEDLTDRQIATPGERFMLAQLYEATGRWTKAKETLGILVSGSSTSDAQRQAYLAHLIRGLLRNGEAAAAESWFAQLDKLAPTDLETVELKARLLRAQGKSEESISILKNVAAENSDIVNRVAAILEEIGEPGPAEELYRGLLAEDGKKTQNILLLAGFLARQKRTGEALDLCEDNWTTFAPEVIAEACVGILYTSTPADETQLRRASGLIEAAIKMEPQSISLTLQLAAVRNLQGKYKEVETLYRQILEKDAKNAVALNNLAWLMAVNKGDKNEALRLVNRAIESSGPIPDLLDTRAVVFIAMNQPDQALKDLESAVAASPSDTSCFHLAQVQLLKKNRPAAENALQRAKDAGLNSGSIHPLEKSAFDSVLAELKKN